MFDSTQLVAQIAITDYKDIVEDPVFGVQDMNEFLVFLKPEIFMGDPAYQAKRIELISAKLEEYEVMVDGMVIVGGKFIEDKGIMSAHYGFINQISNGASHMVTATERAKMTELLGEDCSQFPIYGGHEALKQFADLNPQTLDTLWFTKKSLKIKGGFYFQKYTHADQDFLLVDGFHPAQLSYFTEPSHRVLLMVCHSKTSWKSLRWDLIGSTFPEKADPNSIRGLLYAQAKELGFEKVDIGCNGIHLSAGPFEALFELPNFVGKALEKDVVSDLSLVKYMQNEGISMEQIKKCMTNPTVTVDGKSKDLYGATEDVDPVDAVKMVKLINDSES